MVKFRKMFQELVVRSKETLGSMLATYAANLNIEILVLWAYPLIAQVFLQHKYEHFGDWTKLVWDIHILHSAKPFCLEIWIWTN